MIVAADHLVLLRQRPPKGLLGGMTEVPTTAWSADFDTEDAAAHAPKLPVKTAWRRLPGTVSHTFTHFPLELTVYRAHIARPHAPDDGSRWIALPDLAGEALPSVRNGSIEIILIKNLRAQ